MVVVGADLDLAHSHKRSPDEHSNDMLRSTPFMTTPGSGRENASATVSDDSLTLGAASSASFSASTHVSAHHSFSYDASLMAFPIDGDAAFAMTLQNGSLSAKAGRGMHKKTSDQDFMNLPFDLTSCDTSLPPSYATYAYPFTAPAVSLPPLPLLDTNPLAFDRGLDSPLGLDSPYSEFLASPMFDDAGDVPPPLDFDYPTLFPPAPTTTPSFGPTVSAPSSATHLHPSPALPALHSSSHPTPSVQPLPFCETSTAVPALSEATEAAPRPRPTGFRGASTPLVPIDAPIQPRSYLIPSVTSRKRKTTAVERELAKRGCAPASKDEATPIVEEPIPSDLVAAVERKRLQNTLAARKSRQRKQERLGELEERNRELEEENDGLKQRVKQLEGMLKSLGLTL